MTKNELEVRARQRAIEKDTIVSKCPLCPGKVLRQYRYLGGYGQRLGEFCDNQFCDYGQWLEKD